MRVNIIDLIGQPGETRALKRAVPAAEFGVAPWGPTVAAVHDPVRLDLHLDAVVEGILVRGDIGFTVELTCARCLQPRSIEQDVEVTELFIDPTRREVEEDDDPGYELIDDRTAIDLSTLTRDALLIELPVRVLCREDCQGLCATCGADRNVTDCGHLQDPLPDHRWSALADLDLPPG